MAWTSADADRVRAAVVDLAAGKRAVQLTYGTPPRTVMYAAAQLGELKTLLAEIERSINGVRRYRRFAFSKGFDPRSNRG